MTTFVPCQGCGRSLHHTAPVCPQCGAPTSPPASPSTGAVPSHYSAVPWFRRRWFTILCVMTITPVAAGSAMTGDLYYLAKGQVKTLPDLRVPLGLLSLMWLINLFKDQYSGWTLSTLGVSIVLAVLIGFKR